MRDADATAIAQEAVRPKPIVGELARGEQRFPVARVAMRLEDLVAVLLLWAEDLGTGLHPVVVGIGRDQRGLELCKGLQHPLAGDGRIAESLREELRVGLAALQFHHYMRCR